MLPEAEVEKPIAIASDDSVAGVPILPLLLVRVMFSASMDLSFSSPSIWVILPVASKIAVSVSINPLSVIESVAVIFEIFNVDTSPTLTVVPVRYALPELAVALTLPTFSMFIPFESSPILPVSLTRFATIAEIPSPPVF